MAFSSRYASYVEEEDWDLETLELVNSHLEKYVKMLPRAQRAQLSLAELQEEAGRQQEAMEAAQLRQQASREAKLRLLQQQEARHRQLASESARLQRVRERVEAQELKLQKLRALRGQVEQCRASNGTLNSDLEAVRALFNEKEKELALAVGRVDMLMKQLQDLREVKVKRLVPAGGHRGGGGGGGEPPAGLGGALPLELERLKQELVLRNKANEQQSGRLAAQQQLLQQRKDEAQRMDRRIQELQQRLKKRRSQQQQQQQQQQNQQKQQQQNQQKQQQPPKFQPGTKAAVPAQPQQHQQQGSAGSRLQAWRQAPNVAAVEPYIQQAPRDAKDDLWSEPGFHKQDPKYQTLPPNTKFVPGTDAGSGTRVPSGNAGTGTSTTTQEVNNNEKGGVGVKGRGGAPPNKIPALISSHFSAHRGQGMSSPVNRPTAGSQVPSSVPGKGDAKGPGQESSKPAVVPTASSVQSSSAASSASQQQQQVVSKLPKGPRPFVNTFGKSGLPKWPPDPKKDEDEEEAAAAPPMVPKPAPPPPPAPAPSSLSSSSSSSSATILSHHQQPPHHPQINIFDEERQAGSGQSSPASSEGSGPLVRQGSGVFVVGHPLAVTSSSSSQNSQPSASIAPPGGRPPPENTFPGQSGSSLSASDVQEPPPPPRVPHSASSLGPSTDPSTQHSTKVATKARTGSVEDSSVDPSSSFSRLDGGESVISGGVPQGTLSSSASGGDTGKTGSMVHLNQRPAPTYRYASKNVIANTYMGRLGSSALERYQQLNKQLYSTIDSRQGSNTRNSSSSNQTPLQQQQQQQQQEPAGDASQKKKTLAGELRTAFGPSQPDGSSSGTSEGLAGGDGGMTQFGLVGSPSYPDIASDKGSFKANTPKHIRRRHSDSDNEDAARPFHRGGEKGHKNEPQDSNSRSNSNRNAPTATTTTTTTTANNEDASRASKVPRAQRLGSGSGGGEGTSGQEQVKGGGKAAAGEVVARKKAKTILKAAGGDQRRKSSSSSSNRVRFDPLALLLDASLEGEVDLVTRTAREVSDVSTPNDEGITALHNAICAGHYDIVKFLIEFGADVNSPDSDGWTPLHCAASCNNLPMVRFLVEHGACIFATTISDNETAAEKCEEDEDGYDRCSDYLYSTQEKLGIANDGVVYAVFDYYVNNHDELPFRINDKLTVLRKGDDVEKEWWWARLTPDKEGYIPRNLLGMYPRVLPSSHKPHGTSDC